MPYIVINDSLSRNGHWLRNKILDCIEYSACLHYQLLTRKYGANLKKVCACKESVSKNIKKFVCVDNAHCRVLTFYKLKKKITLKCVPIIKDFALCWVKYFQNEIRRKKMIHREDCIV